MLMVFHTNGNVIMVNEIAKITNHFLLNLYLEFLGMLWNSY